MPTAIVEPSKKQYLKEMDLDEEDLSNIGSHAVKRAYKGIATEDPTACDEYYCTHTPF